MNFYALLISIHVVVAVVGTGLFGALPIGARAARRSGLGLTSIYVWARPLLRWTRVSLGVVFLSGGLLDFAAGRAFHERAWFRASFALLVLAGLLQWRASVTLRRGRAAEMDDARALRRFERLGFTSAAAVACIAVLMELKPF